MAGPYSIALVAANSINDYKYMPPITTATSNQILPATASSSSAVDYFAYPLIRRHGRIYLRDPDNPYPFPCDLPEIHRQTLRSLSLINVFGAPFCNPFFERTPPLQVLEVACGSAFWSSACHDYFSRRGHHRISFTGLDIANIAPDLRKQGVNWQFKKHDLFKPRIPFPDNFFDFVFIKDTGMASTTSAIETSLHSLKEPLRVLKSGGTLEIWEADIIVRTLLPNPPSAPGLGRDDQKQANATATYTISSATPFAKAQNKYLQDYNKWVQEAFERIKLSPMPCAAAGFTFSSASDSFSSVDTRRIAIPFSEVRWEGTPGPGYRKALTPEQLALRRATLTTLIQTIESMEPMLMEASGKSRDEWDRWWAGMTADLMQKNGAASGECLEVGAWWGKKR
jgi:ubiquinone/menaquinone biosynthesis C-methylase UbiE